MPRPPDRTREAVSDAAANLGTGQSDTLNYTESQEQEETQEPDKRYPVVRPASTRVAAYRFVPTMQNGVDTNMGTLCVQFIKRGDRYVYPNVPSGTYTAFNTPGTSKGKFINAVLNGIGYHRATGQDQEYFGGF